jgi:hypothetical protein
MNSKLKKAGIGIGTTSHDTATADHNRTPTND